MLSFSIIDSRRESGLKLQQRGFGVEVDQGLQLQGALCAGTALGSFWGLRGGEASQASARDDMSVGILP